MRHCGGGEYGGDGDSEYGSETPEEKYVFTSLVDIIKSSMKTKEGLILKMTSFYASFISVKISHVGLSGLSINGFLALLLFAFITRRMVRSAHLALSPKVFTAQFDFATSNRYSYEKIHIASLGTAQVAYFSTRHYIKPSPKGSGSM